MSGNITDILKAKKTLLEELLDTINKAMRLLKEDNVDEFDRELQSCEQIMRKVDELGKTPSEEMSPADVEIGKEIEQLFGRIVQANNALRELSEEKLKSYGSQIKAIRQKRQGLDAYNRSSNSAVFIDEKQ
ncbi:MAG: hypothetical protein ACM3S4_08180 [Burkholderiales bacterium]